MLGHAVIEDDVDCGGEIDGVVAGDGDHVAAPGKDARTEVAIFRPKDVEGAFGVVIVGQGDGAGAALNSHRHAVIGDDGAQVVYLEQGQMTVGVAGISGLDAIARPSDGDQGRTKAVGGAAGRRLRCATFWDDAGQSPHSPAQTRVQERLCAWLRQPRGLDTPARVGRPQYGCYSVLETTCRHVRYQLENCHQAPTVSAFMAW